MSTMSKMGKKSKTSLTKAPLMDTISDTNPLFCHYPLKITCPSCGHYGFTRCITARGNCSYLTACIVCVFCCPFFWIPLVIPTTKDWVHYCTKCDTELGRCRIL